MHEPFTTFEDLEYNLQTVKTSDRNNHILKNIKSIILEVMPIRFSVQLYWGENTAYIFIETIFKDFKLLQKDYSEIF